ncbi:MAG: hypothetical protein IJ887_08490 [Prevotella sp.]|nr:hypothetical protein [Prevotella sp.]
MRSRLVGGIAGENDGTIENCSSRSPRLASSLSLTVRRR